MKGVFTTRIDPSYDDQPEERYHFPRTYLRQAESTVGDFIVYYEPSRTGGASHRRDGSQTYFATARVKAIVEDSSANEHFYALIDTPTYLNFDTPVPFRNSEGTFERRLLKDDGTTNKGAFGRAIRNLQDDEYEAIVAAGFRADLPDFVPDAPLPPGPNAIGLEENETLFVRPIVELTVSRPFRDRAFSRQVRQAYDRTCAFSGLKILNGFGRPEVQAAHIKPVTENGPDIVKNGLALSSTFHWLFDRGLISLTDDFKILTVKHDLPDNLIGLLNRNGYANTPVDHNVRPHPHYLRYHRENIFKGQRIIRSRGSHAMNNAPIFLTLFFGLFLAIGLAILGFGLRSLSLSKQAEGWPTTQGRIVSSDFVTDTDDDGTTYRTKLSYDYAVAGRDYTGDKIAFGYSASSGHAFHREIYEVLPVNSQVAVRYDESNPARAVLAFGVNQSILFLLIFGGVWTMFTLGMALMFWLSEKGAGGLLQTIIVYSRG